MHRQDEGHFVKHLLKSFRDPKQNAEDLEAAHEILRAVKGEQPKQVPVRTRRPRH
jgi:hypothetical protein